MTTDVTIINNRSLQDYDLVIDSNGDLASGDFFDSSLRYSIYGERRASPSEVPISEKRRGWLGNEGQDFENGSKLWLFEQERLTREILNDIASTGFSALSWLVEDNILSSIEVSTVLQNGITFLVIDLFRFNSKVDRRFFQLWENTTGGI